MVASRGPMTKIAAVRCALPPYRHRQAELTSMFGELCEVERGRRTLLERLHANAGICLYRCINFGCTVIPLGWIQGLARIRDHGNLIARAADGGFAIHSSA